tara:strand:+ start:44891 stop:45394 length:504 start_codon:yes stop_codon:yes gene_type:complete
MKKIATFFLLSFLFGSLIAQNGSSLLPFSGKIFTESKKDNKVTVKLYDGNKLVSSYETKANGKFIMDLERNKKYTVEFSQTAYVTKRISIDTKVNPKEVELLKEFKFDVDLIKEEEGINYSNLDFPIALIEFEKHSGQFDYNKAYTENMLKEQERILGSDYKIAMLD